MSTKASFKDELKRLRKDVISWCNRQSKKSREFALKDLYNLATEAERYGTRANNHLQPKRRKPHSYIKGEDNMFYKLTQNGKVIDVTDYIEYCKYQERNNLVIRCNADDPDIRGVISQRLGRVFHLADKPDFPQKAGIFLTVFLTEISESEYVYLLDQLNKETEPIDPEITDIEMARRVKIDEMDTTCHNVIIAGIDVTLSDSITYHFDLDEEDQTNLGELRQLAEKGIDRLPYHAAGDLCIYYSAADIITITNKAITHKTYHTTYYNSLKNYINHIETIDAVNAITYGVAIPEEYQSEVLKDLLNQLSA